MTRHPRDRRQPVFVPEPDVEVVLHELAAGGDAVGRMADGRALFVPRGAPGDRVQVELTERHKSFARGRVRALLAPSVDRQASGCDAFDAGCGGCAWRHVTPAVQAAAKHAIVVRALRHPIAQGLAVAPLVQPCAADGWRRRVRLHVEAGQVGFFAARSHAVLVPDRCPQLAPALDAARQVVAAAEPPDGDLAMVLGHQGDIALATQGRWPGARALVGRAGIVSVVTADGVFGAADLELEPGLRGRADDFAQASAAGNHALRRELAAMVATAQREVAAGPAAPTALELYAGSGNFTRDLVGAGWQVTASDFTAPVPPVAHTTITGAIEHTLRKLAGKSFDLVVVDPPRAGLAPHAAAIAALATTGLVYVSCDPATLARDLGIWAGLGWRAVAAVPIDLMPGTDHVEVVVRCVRG